MPGVHAPRHRYPSPMETSSNGFPSSSRHPPSSASYYYSRGGVPPLPLHTSPAMSSYVRAPPSKYNGNVGNTGSSYYGNRQTVGPVEQETPSYWVEHLATFAVGREFGLLQPSDGVRKLKQLEKNSAIWAQPMVLRLRPTMVSVEDENGDLVEQFPMDLVADPTAHLSNDPRDVYNNILLFVVKEDKKRGRTVTPTEMHIFQCNRISASEVVEDMKAYLAGHYQRVRTGRRDTGFVIGPTYHAPSTYGGGPVPGSHGIRDDISASTDSNEYFERDVNTLNRCFDDIERFVARIQSAAIAQKELEAQAFRFRTAQRKRGANTANIDAQSGILQMRAQLPAEYEFVDILQKFKLSFNLLAKLKNHIHEPNAPELLHFLFTPLTIILDACHWGLGRNVAPQVISPLLTRDARDLMQNCLTSKESDVWMALGEAWRIPPEDWVGPLPRPYRPVFVDGFAPYGLPDMYETDSVQQSYQKYPPQPIHRGVSAPPPQTQKPYTARIPVRDRSVDNLNIDLDRLTLEKERLEFEREKIAERERRLHNDERRIHYRHEKQRLAAERELMAQEAEQRSMGSSYAYRANDDNRSRQDSPSFARRGVQYVGQVNGEQRRSPSIGPIPQVETSPRQKAFLDDIVSRKGKLVQVTYDRIAQNPKELTVSRGEYLEVLNDLKNWWECKNVHHRVGYVPHTILSSVNLDRNLSPHSLPPQDPSLNISERLGISTSHHNPMSNQGGSLSPRPGELFIPPEPNNIDDIMDAPGGGSEDNMNISNRNIDSPQNGDDVDKFKKLKSPLFEEPIIHLQEILDKEKERNITQRYFKQTPKNTCNYIDQKSTAEDVHNWLEGKYFTSRTIEALSGTDGKDLFSANKEHLVTICGREEGNRLNGQIILQKKMTGYGTPSVVQLKEILRFRKQHVDATNEAAAEEPINSFSG